MSTAVTVLSVLLLAAGAGGAEAEESSIGEPRSERLSYGWRLEGLSGVISRLFRLLPTSGDALMELRVEPHGRLQIEFIASSEQAKPTDYWKHETAVDLGAWRSVRAAETLHFRKRRKHRSWELEKLGVIDVLGGLQLLRFSPPGSVERRTIWSDEKLYPVTVASSGLQRRSVGGREVTVRHLAIRGVKERGARRWAARADLWLTNDEAGTPLEILYSQSLGQLRLTLVDAASGR